MEDSDWIKMRKLENEVEDLKKQIKELEEEKRRMESGTRERYEKEKDLAKNYLQLFGSFGDGIKIPLDDDIKKAISNYIFTQMRSILESNEDFEDKFIRMALNYKNAFVKIFTPIVKDIIHDLDFNVSFKTCYGDDD